MYEKARQIRLFVVDGQQLIAAALSHLFASDEAFRVVGCSQIVRALTLRTACPDVIMLGHEHGSTAMCAMVAQCKDAVPAAKVCVVACHSHPELMQSVIDAGADGYTIKDVSPSEVMHAFKTIAAGTIYVDPRVTAPPSDIRGRSQRSSQSKPYNPLSAREIEIIKLIADGRSNKQISVSLALSEKTIKNHISRIFSKLHITARTQAVIHALKTGIA